MSPTTQSRLVQQTQECHTYDLGELPQSQKQSLSKPMSSFWGNMLKFKYAQWLVNYLVGLIINNISYGNILTTKLFYYN